MFLGDIPNADKENVKNTKNPIKGENIVLSIKKIMFFVNFYHTLKGELYENNSTF